VEANPVNFRKLVSNLSGIGSMIGFLNCAVFDGSRNHAFMSDKNDKSAMVLQNQPWMVQGQEVKCVSLDQVLSLYDEDVVLKMDIEGGEYATLPSASRTNLRKCKMLFLETHTPPPGTDHLGESRPSSFLKEYVMSSGFTVENEQQFASWDIDGAGNQFNYNVIPNAKSFRFARID
jgi:FkbM family methyltransferase